MRDDGSGTSWPLTLHSLSRGDVLPSSEVTSSDAPPEVPGGGWSRRPHDTVCPSLTPPGPATKPSANPTAKYGSPRHRRLGLRSVEHFRRRLPLLIRLQPHRTRPEQPRRPPVHLVPRTQQPQHHQLPHRPGGDSRLRGTHHQDGVIDRCWQTAISTRPINARSETIFSVPTLATLYQCRPATWGPGTVGGYGYKTPHRR